MPPQRRAKFVICHLCHGASGGCLDLMNVAGTFVPFLPSIKPRAFETNKSSGPAFAALTDFWQPDSFREKAAVFVDETSDGAFVTSSAVGADKVQPLNRRIQSHPKTVCLKLDQRGNLGNDYLKNIFPLCSIRTLKQPGKADGPNNIWKYAF